MADTSDDDDEAARLLGSRASRQAGDVDNVFAVEFPEYDEMADEEDDFSMAGSFKDAITRPALNSRHRPWATMAMPWHNVLRGS